MFVGHFAAGFAAKRLAPRTSLGVLLAAALLPDLIWAALVLAGVEEVRIAPGDTAFTPLAFVSYPVSHSLLTTAVWSALAALIVLRIGGDAASSIVVALAVSSHWLLDAISHRPDLPIAPGWGARAGLGLWNSVPATLAVEGSLYIAGVAVYLRSTRARDRIGVWALASLVGLLALLYVSSAFGPAPPDPRAVAIADLAGILFLAWGAWVDRHREAIPQPA